MLNIGDKAPDFCVSDICLSDFRGSWVVLYFYRSHFGLLCTKLTIAFNERYDEFRKLGAVIIGISRENVELEDEFRKFLKLRIFILSDTDGSLFDMYGVGGEEEFFKRGTFLIDPNGYIREIWYYYDIENVVRHVEEVLSRLKMFRSGSHE